MLFKILHGDDSRISTDITPYHEGYAYVTHKGDFYVDMNGKRIKLNAKDAETLMGASLSTVLNDNEVEIPTSKAVLDAINLMDSNVVHTSEVVEFTEAEITSFYDSVIVQLAEDVKL